MPVVAAAALTVGGTLYAGSQANKAANKQADLSQQTTNRIIDLQQQNLEATRKAEQPYINTGYAGLDALMQSLGLGAKGGEPDYAAYGQQNPDVLAWAQNGGGDPSKPIGEQSIEDRLAYHYANSGQSEGRALPTTPGSSGGGPDLSSLGTRQSYTRPASVALPSMPDLSPASYQKSPGYDYQQKEGIRNLNASFGARGLLRSGAAIKGVETFSQNLADQDYQQWRGNELAQWQARYNAAMAANNLQNQTFESDRQYGTGVYDADRGYLTNAYNTQNQNLLSLANLGQAGISATNAAGSAATNNISGQLNQNANVLSDAYGQKAATNASVWNNVAGVGANLLGGWGGGSVGQIREQTPISASGYSYFPQGASTPPFNPNLLRTSVPNPVF